MKHLKRIDEAVGTINERRASAESLLKAVVNGDAKDVEGITLSKAMADAYLAWLQQSTYGKKFSGLPFYKLFDASFNWGIERYIDSKLKGELKELKAQAKSMKEGKELNEGKMWNDVAKIMDKALKQADVPLSYARDYVKSLERMAKKNSKKFFDEYGNFSEDDFIEDVEYNMANESKVNEGPDYDEAKYQMDKIFGDDQESIETFQDIEDNGTVKDMVDYINNWGNEEELNRYGIRSDAHIKKFAKKIMENVVNEAKNFADLSMKVSDLIASFDDMDSIDLAGMFELNGVFDESEATGDKILAIWKKNKTKTIIIKTTYSDNTYDHEFNIGKDTFICTTSIPWEEWKDIKFKVLENMLNVVTEAAPKMKKNVEAENIQELMNQIANAQKGGGSGRYGKEFDKAKTKALRAIKDMVMYSKIGI